MGSRWVRTAIVIVALATLGFAGNQIRFSDAAFADEQGGERVFTDLGWALQLALAELRSAQQAYVADGQDREYWTAQVDVHLEAVLDSLDNLKQQVADPDALAALDDAVAAVGDIRGLDEDAREYIGSDQPLQASDLIFTRGLDLVDRAGAHVQAALQAQRASRLDMMRAVRAGQARMMWAAAVVVVLAMLVLAPTGAAAERDPSPADEEYDVPESTGLSLLALDNDSAGDPHEPPADDPADAADGPAGAPADGPAVADPARESPRHPPAAPDLDATAALCTDFGNLTKRDQIPGLLARTAALMNARVLIVWTGHEDAGILQPVLAHGYALERIGPIPLEGSDPMSAAFAARRIRTVESEGADNGALAAPLMVADRCVGVLSAELRGGWESSGAVQATASIVAAQLAPLLPAEVPAAAPLPAATGTHDTAGSETGTAKLSSS